MRVLVTGGNGFMGAWIIRRLLARGCHVRVFDRTEERRLVDAIAGPDSASGVSWHTGDIAQAADVLAAMDGCGGVIHLAGVLTAFCAAEPVRGAEINLIGTLNVFDAAIAHGLDRVIYTSSAGVFGPDDPVNPAPASHYGAFKLACEGSARAYWTGRGMPSVGFRPFIVYGPGRETGVSAGPTLACRAAARGEGYAIPFTGTVGMVYVEDVAAAYEAALFGPCAGARVLNLAGEPADMNTVIALIRDQVPGAALSCEGPPLPITAGVVSDPMDGLDAPPTPLAEGLARTIAFYRQVVAF